MADRLTGLRRRLFQGMASLFQTGGETCAVCAASLRGSAGSATGSRLCSHCASLVPWIVHIRCAVCGRASACPDCPRRTDTAFVCNRSAVVYTPEMKRWLSRLKFRGDEGLADLFAFMLEGALERLMAEHGLRRRDVHCLIPVPLSGDRLAERGFNQTELIVRRLAEACRIPSVPLLVRVRHTGKMSQKSRAERLSQLAGAYRLAQESGSLPPSFRSAAGRPLRMVLVDDVYTTGSTMQACARVLREAAPGAEIYGLTWAR